MLQRNTFRGGVFFILLGVTRLIADDFIPSLDATYFSGEIWIDGLLKEAIWQEAKPATRFVQKEPVEGVLSRERTEVRVLFDEKTIYVGAIMYDSQPDSIGDQLVRRDEKGQYDYFEVSFDPNNDNRTGYLFRVSAVGVQRDAYLYNDVREDVAWDAVWESVVNRDSTGWSVELRIPISQLRYEASDTTQSWGVNFSRRRLASNERTYFALESRLVYGKVSVFGRLNGLLFHRSSHRAEGRPYVLASARTAPAVPDDPFFDGSEQETQIGMDLRYGLGSTHTLNLTLNPDFGQVEVDPAVINLSAFETFFPEKRLFFVEESQIFDFRLSGWRDRLFYSRRIGREPHGSAPPGSSFDSIPTQTRIQSAVKLTGRTPTGLTLGVLAALTRRELGLSINDSDTLNTPTKFTVEPASQYGVVRLQQDFHDGGSQLGAIVTAVHRDMPADRSTDFLTSHAFSTGVDFEHNWGGTQARNWALSGYLTGSLIQGSTTALTRIQQSSNHYFQRPDATRFSLDSSATSMTGLNWQLQFERRSAKHWTGGVWISEVTPGFEINDLGFSQSGERLNGGSRITYQEIIPGRFFRRYRFTFFTFQNWRHEALDDVYSWNSWKRAHKWGTFSASTDVQFLNYWGFNFDARYSPELLTDIGTRGGPLMINPASTSLRIRANTDRRDIVYWGPSINYVYRHRGGYLWRGAMQVVFRPSSNWEIQLQPDYSIDLEPAQYVATTDNVEYAPTFGHRYLFADLYQRSFSIQSRIDVAFTPRLTLQFFIQPLLSSGDYLAYKQLKRSESFEFDKLQEGLAVVGSEGIYCLGGRTCVSADGMRHIDFDSDGVADFSFNDQNFSIRSLRMNLVLQWEYRPGSTLYLVWQRTSRSWENFGLLDFNRDATALLKAAPENILILKFNYWFGM